MSIALSEEHQELARVAGSFLEAHEARAETRALLEEVHPEKVDSVTFRKKQYEHGLAWVHFPEGLGGLGLSPRLNTLVFDEIDACLSYANIWAGNHQRDVQPVFVHELLAARVADAVIGEEDDKSVVQDELLRQSFHDQADVAVCHPHGVEVG